MAGLISRDAAIEAMRECWRRVNQFAKPFEANRIMDCINAVKDLPAVDAVPVVHGEWIEEPDREGHYHCSNCGVVWGVSAMAMKHCPNCTAKMTNSPLWDMEDEAATEMTQYCERYELTYNPEDGSM